VIKNELPKRASSEVNENENINQIVSHLDKDNEDSKSDEDASNENNMDKYEAFKVSVQQVPFKSSK
jgi:hypothetical protein